MVQRRELIIDPQCKNLIAQLKYARWKQGDRMTYERSETYGHYDLVDALVILVSNIVRGRNPVPEHYDIYSQTHTVRQPTPESREVQKLVPPQMRKIRRPF
jgi:hypothetical protein